MSLGAPGILQLLRWSLRAACVLALGCGAEIRGDAEPGSTDLAERDAGAAAPGRPGTAAGGAEPVAGGSQSPASGGRASVAPVDAAAEPMPARDAGPSTSADACGAAVAVTPLFQASAAGKPIVEQRADEV